MKRTFQKYSKKIADKTGWLAPGTVPDFLNIEPTNFCNLKCRLCPTGNDILKREKGFMTLDMFKSILAGWRGKNTRIDFSGYGEPFLNKDFLEMIRLAKQNSFSVSILTNGNLLSEEKARLVTELQVDSLIVALDGASQASYQWYRRGGDFNKVVENLKNLVRFKKEKNSPQPFIQLQFVVMKRNESEIEQIKKIAAEISVDELILKTCGFYQSIGMSFDDFQKEYLPQNKKYWRLESESKPVPNFVCPWMNKGAMIFWDGRISACCYDPDGKIILGQVSGKENFINQWRHSTGYKVFRQNGARGIYLNELCQRCPAKFRISKGEYFLLNK